MGGEREEAVIVGGLDNERGGRRENASAKCFIMTRD